MDMASNESGLGLVWGAGPIGRVIGRTERVTFNLLEKGEIPAKKVGGRWVAKRDALERFFEETAA